MQKFIAVLSAMFVVTANLMGCSASAGAGVNQNIISYTTNTTNSSEQLEIVCTIYPVYDWVNQIVGENTNINVTFLCDSGIDLHSYQPTIQDIVVIQESDLFVYVGGDSDTWADSVVDDSYNTMNLIEILGDIAVFQEEVEGMQEHDHDHDHSHDYGTGVWGTIRTFFSNIYHAIFPHDHSHDDLYDEHVWLSLKNAAIFVDALCTELINLSPDNQVEFESNAIDYINILADLDNQYTQMTSQANRNTILVADRFPLRYIVDDYNLEYFAAFSGCSADVEVSFDTLTFLTDKVSELDLDYILTVDGSDGKLAETIANDNDVEGILMFNSMQSITQNEISNGANFLNIMQSNLEVLTKALQ